MPDADPDLHRLSPSEVLRRAEKMVAAGRMSDEEAARLRAAAESGGLGHAVGEIRRKHAQARVREAVASGRLGEEEAAGILEKLERGADPRHLLRDVRRGAPRPAQDRDDPETLHGG